MISRRSKESCQWWGEVGGESICMLGGEDWLFLNFKKNYLK